MSISSGNSDSGLDSGPSSTPSELAIQLPRPFFPPSLSKRSGDQVEQNNNARSLKKTRLPLVPLEEQVTTIAPDDRSTPDSWVPRDTRLIRLTGKHPFNCEPPITELLDAGFLTPSNLFYVRNHGAVPRVDQAKADGWTLRIHGLVEKEISFSIQDLMARFETVTLPITLVCAGNRRKEQNIVAKSLGFNWGAAGLSTALFTGVYLSDILEACGVQKGAKHVIFEGIDALPNGYYGTSQKLHWAKDRTRGMLISWAMNGLPLEPDHGYPLRLVVPGQIGGRSVKWLNRIEVSAQESQHYLHFWDNKVLPMQFTADEARAKKDIWYDPKYIITELNSNSAIAYPDHDEELDLAKTAPDAEYTVKGYAYSGGGRRINRVEISMDGEHTWKLAEISYPEDLYRAVCDSNPIYGNLDLSDREETCFCWCFWSFKIPIESLKSIASLSVRCMDEGLSGQPSDMYWNPTALLRMMNNWYFRVVVHNQGDKLRFEHPTKAGVVGGGWMQRLKDQGADPAQPAFGSDDVPKTIKPKVAEVSMVNGQINRKITMAELEAHNKAEEPWFVVQGEVYDGTAFLDKHPGGGESITIVAGEDATEDFMAIHSSDAKTQLAAFHIGTLDPTSVGSAGKQAVNLDSPVFLDAKQWKPVKLIEIKKVSPDTRVYRFALTRGDQPFGLPTGQHVFMRLRRKGKGKEVIQGELLQRAYTPVSFKSVGYVDFLIKIYFPNQAFPEGGAMTQAVEELEVGDTIELKGPLGSFTHLGNSTIRWRGRERNVKQIGLISGGTGITPIMQVLQGVFADTEDKSTECWVVNGNRNEHDILMREDLDHYLATHGPSRRFRLHNTLSAPSNSWTDGKGRINIDTLRTHLPPVHEDNIVCLCGPDPMQESVKSALTNLGWDIESQLVVF